MYMCTHSSNYFLILSSFLFVFCLNFRALTLSSGFVLCILSLQILWCEWQLLKHLSWHNPKYVRYRNLAILILFWTASNITDYIFLWLALITFCGRYLLYPSHRQLHLKCSLQVVTCLCLWISKLRNRTTNSLSPTCAKRNIISEK